MPDTIARMGKFIVLLVHSIATGVQLAKPGGLRSVIAESVLVRHQLLVLNAAANLRPTDRIIGGLCTPFMRPSRLLRAAIVLRPATLLYFHKALTKRKYRLLFSPKRRRQPGPQD